MSKDYKRTNFARSWPSLDFLIRAPFEWLPNKSDSFNLLLAISRIPNMLFLICFLQLQEDKIFYLQSTPCNFGDIRLKWSSICFLQLQEDKIFYLQSTPYNFSEIMLK
ncbi:hypothetical protein EPI10_021780 [Gossypium australe]|uniref:Uncharacterized protein n=1 Tax=Gossypium australe TaxID=47621 RepID=A0A5B6WKQ8_9ROSI|nr:hypothetical protein EPI10_021780 [Gossypium australe]